jgi:hypothetical protein
MGVDFKTWHPLFGSALLAAGLVWLFQAPVETQRALAAENGPVELALALFYLAAMALAAYGAVQTSGALRWYLVLWMLLCLAFFGEETSWFQHMLHYETPSWMTEKNAQGEFNLHNLEIFQGGQLVGAEFRWRSLLRAQNLFNLGFVAYFFGLPLLASGAAGRRLLPRLKIPYPGKRLVAFAFLPLAVSAALTLLAGTQETKATVAETREMICALVILTFVALASRPAASSASAHALTNQER